MNSFITAQLRLCNCIIAYLCSKSVLGGSQFSISAYRNRLVRLCLPITLVVFSHSVIADHASASFETGAAGVINTLSGSTLPKGKLVFAVGTQFIELDDISNERLEELGAINEEVHSTDSLLNLTANVVYGVTDNLSIGFSLPYVDRQNVSEAENDGPGVGEADLAGDSSGIGDLSLFGQYRFYNSKSMDVAIIVGVQTPTGDTDEKEIAGVLFEAEQQPGSGSWDPFTGISFNQSWGRTGITSNLLYTIVTEGTQDTDLGNIFNYNIAASYRAYLPEEGHDHHHDHENKIVDYMNIVLELNGDYRERVEVSNVEDSNTGGHTLYLSPGVRLGIGHTWSLYSSLGIPIVNDLGGIQSDPDYRITAGISTTF